ncbi:hypothetical protein OAD61_00460 [bacterium]|nr:hypothetical protein [bacterium]
MIDETFEQFQQRMHCAQVNCDQIEKYYWDSMQEEKVLKQRIAELEADKAELQMKLDNVMFEYCPDEMSQEQTNNWAKYQQPAKEQAL